MQRQISVFADWNAIPTLLAFSDALEADWQLSHDYVYLLRLVIEEVATNIIKYGYDDNNRDQIYLSCQYDQGTLTITIRDRGRSFDPRDAPPLISAVLSSNGPSVDSVSFLCANTLTRSIIGTIR